MRKFNASSLSGCASPTKDSNSVLRTLAFVALFIFSETAFGAEPPSYLNHHDSRWVKVTQAQITPIGSGLRGKKSDRVLSVACSPESVSCEKLRFIYLEDKEAYWLGADFKIEDEKQFRKALKQFLKDARERQHDNIRFFASYGSFVAGCAWFGITGLLAPAGIGALILLVLDPNTHKRDLLTPFYNLTERDRSHQLTKTDDWNWTEKTKPMKEKLFAQLVSDLQDNYTELKLDFSPQYTACALDREACGATSFLDCTRFAVKGWRINGQREALSDYLDQSDAAALLNHYLSTGTCIQPKR